LALNGIMHHSSWKYHPMIECGKRVEMWISTSKPSVVNCDLLLLFRRPENYLNSNRKGSSILLGIHNTSFPSAKSVCLTTPVRFTIEKGALCISVSIIHY
jgi:hypothetical protein